MILKSLSRKSNVGSLIKYIFKEQAGVSSNWRYTEQKQNWFVPGVKLSKADIRYLNAEKEDRKLMDELKAFKGSVKEFIQTRLINKSPTHVPSKQQDQKPFLIKHNVRAKTIEGFCREFDQNQSRRLHARSDQVKAYHTILSWSPKDAAQLTDAMLKDIAGEFVRLRGNNCLVVGTKHIEKDHIHLHLAVSGTQLNGKSSRQSKAEFQALKTKLQQYQMDKYKVLAHSLPEHGKSKVKDAKGPEKNIKTERRLSDKQSLLKCLDEAYKTSTSKDHFLSQLQALGHQPYFRNDKFQGIKFEGDRKFRINRLGYDEQKLQALDLIKAIEEKELQEIQKLRERKSLVREQTQTINARFEIPVTETDKEKQREKLQGLVNSNIAFEEKHGISRDGSVPIKEKNPLEELRSIRENRSAEMAKGDSQKQNGREINDEREADSDRDNKEEKKDSKDEDAKDHDSANSTAHSQTDDEEDDNTDVR